MRRRDYIVIIALLALALVAQTALRSRREPAGYAVISVSGRIVGKMPLNVDGVTRGEGALGPYELRCESRAVSMSYSVCEDQLCVSQGAIRMAGQAIICLPNQVSVRLDGAADGDMDAVAH